MGKERRNFPRVDISFPVECELLPERKKIFYTVTKNLSIEGAKILTEEFFPKDSMLRINLNLINEMVIAKTKVVWCNKEPYSERYQIGLYFLEINRKNKDKLKALIDKIFHS